MRSVSLFVLLCALLSAPTLKARKRDCLPPKPDQKKVTYCESVRIWSGPHRYASGFAVSFESKFFDGLLRTSTSQGPVFRKNGQVVTNYPDSFIVAVEPPLSLQMLGGVPGIPMRPTPELVPHNIVVRWLSETGETLSETNMPVEEFVEAWPEDRPAKVWYRAKVTGVKQHLADIAEIVVLGEGQSRLATVRGRL